MRSRTSLLILAAIAALAAYPLFQGKFYAVGDMRDLTIPLELFFAQQEKAGHLPTWNPDIAFGFPVLASAQIGFYYPPLLITRLLPLPVYLPLLWLVHLVSGGFGTWYFARHVGLKKTAALFGAISFMLSSFVWQHTTHLNIFFATSYLPWQLLTTSLLARKLRLESRHIIGAALLFGMPLLIGQFQMQAFVALTCVAYALYLQNKNVRRLGTTMAAIAIIAGGAALLSSAQLLPTAELARQSSRSEGGRFDLAIANQYSFPVYHLPTFLWPRFFGSDDTYWGRRLEIEYGVAIGTLPLVLAAAYLWRWRRRYHPPLVFIIWLLGISFALSLGSLSPIRLLGIEPTFWIFSAPARWLGLTTFALSILAAAGWQYTLDTVSARAWWRIGGIMLAGIALANAALYSTPLLKQVSSGALQYLNRYRDEAYYEDKFSIIESSARQSSVSFTSWYTYLPLIAVGAAALTRRTAYYQAVVFVVTAVELVAIAATTTPTLTWQDTLRPPDTLAALPPAVRAGDARIFSVRQSGDEGKYFTDPRTRANDAIRVLQRELLVPLISSHFGIAGIEWPASLDIKRVYNGLVNLRGEDGYIIRNNELVHELGMGAILAPRGLEVTAVGKVYAEVGQVIIYATSAAPRVVLVQENRQEIPLTYQATPTELTVTTNEASDTTLLVRDLTFPGWRALVDNQPEIINEHPPFFRTVHVPAGEHTVTMVYQPRSVTLGLTISLVTFAAFCIMLILTKHHENPLLDSHRLPSA